MSNARLRPNTNAAEELGHGCKVLGFIELDVTVPCEPAEKLKRVVESFFDVIET
jgi:hypothetical protein